MNRHNNNNNALLVEIMLAILFFSLCAIMLLQTYTRVHQKSEVSGLQIAAIEEARDILEQLNTSADENAVLLAAGYTQNTDGWEIIHDGVCITVTGSSEGSDGGTLRTYTVQVNGISDPFTLHGARYMQEVTD